MRFLKASIAITFGLLILLILYMMFAFNPDKELDRALEYFLEGDLEQSEETLSSLQSSLTPMQYYLYMSYIERAKKNIDASSQDLKTAEKDALEHANFPLLLEIALNQAFNAYLTHHQEALSQAVKTASRYGGPSEDWVLLFHGIEDYNNGNYADALSMWKMDASRVPLSSWMKKSFADTFSPFWFAVRVARGDIEIGKISAARHLLENQIPQATGEDLNEVLFLMGYSYAVETADKDPTEAIPYYKLALSYFNKIPFQADKYKKERDKLISQAAVKANTMLQNGLYHDFPFYLTLLESWQAHAEVNALKEQAVNQFNRAIALGLVKEANDIYLILRLMLPEGTERQNLKNELQNAVSKETLQNLDQYARTGRLFTESSESPPTTKEINETLADPTQELLPIQALVEKAINDHRINPNFHLERSTDLQKASFLLNNFIDAHKGYKQAYVMLGQVLYLLGDMPGAAKAYEEAIFLDPRDPMTYRYLALVYEDAHQAQDAILLLLKALKYAPKNADLWEQLAGLYIETGNELDAIPSLKEALHLDPEKYALYLDLGKIQVKLEIPEEARQNLQKFLVHEPANKEALKLLLMSLYNPLLVVQVADATSIENQRNDIYQRLYKIDPAAAEKIRKSYHAPPPIVSPPPQPEPSLPFFPQ